MATGPDKAWPLRLLFLFSAAALVISAAVHASTFFGINPIGVSRWVWGLHVLVFVVWIPVVVLCAKSVTKANRRTFWRVVTRSAPRWMKVLSMGLAAYAIFNFLYTGFVKSEGGVPAVIDGERVIHNHGDIIRKITAEEYELHQAYGVRTFSGHWMIFYAAGMTVLCSRLREREAPVDPGEADEAGGRPPPGAVRGS